jgi:hypothetical protein
LAVAATGPIFAKETIYILKDMTLELSKEKLHEAIAYPTYSMNTRRDICKQLCPSAEAVIEIDEVATTSALTDIVWKHWDIDA